jgi:hypothetical protein
MMVYINKKAVHPGGFFFIFKLCGKIWLSAALRW